MNILDIAREAGVSTATVSRVINNGPVSADTRAKVEAAIEKLDYLPNQLARGLITKSTRTIGIITHSLSNSFNTEFFEATSELYRAMNFLQVVCCTQSDPAEERLYLSDLMSRHVDGIILHDTNDRNYRSGFIPEVANRTPIVLVHSYENIYDLNSVIVDQRVGMNKALHHLMELGHRDIWFIRGDDGYSFGLKEEIWRKGLTEVGAPPPSENCITINDANKEQGIYRADEVISDLFASGRRPTAIFACNDIMATGVRNAILRRGLRIPEDISLVGHDNTILAASGGFSSVDLKIRSVAHAAVDLMSYVIENRQGEPRRVLITPELCLRNSTAPTD